MLADIGNGTVNIMKINNRKSLTTQSLMEKMGDSPRGGEMSRSDRGDGHQLGVNQCVKTASNAMMNKLGVTVDETIIQSMIRYGKADIAAEYADVLRQAITEYADSIFALLRKYEYDPKMMRLYITGGQRDAAPVVPPNAAAPQRSACSTVTFILIDLLD